MKNLIIIYWMLISFMSYSQASIKDLFERINEKSFETKIITNKENKVKYYLEKNSFEKISKNKIIDIFKSNNKFSGFSLYPLTSISNFYLYTLISKDLINLNIGLCQPNAISSLIIYDSLTNNLFYKNCTEPTGNLYRLEKDIIKIMFVTSELSNQIFKLDNNLMPISSIKSIKKNDSIFYEISKYDLVNKQFIKRNKLKKGLEENTNKIKYEELTFLLNSFETKFDKIEKCDNKYCDCKISRFFME